MSLGGSSSKTNTKYNEKGTNTIVDKQSGTKTSSSDPSDFQKPWLEGGFAEALKLYMSGDTSALTSLLNGGMGAADGALDKSKQYLFDATSSADPKAALERAAAAGRASVEDPNTAALIDANARGITRNVNENELPSINRAAVAGGNMNSSRTGIAEGLALRGRDEALMDNAARVNAEAFNRGYGSSLTQDNLNTQALFTAASGMGDIYNTGVSAGQLQQQVPWNNFGNFWNTVGGNVWGTNGSESFNQDRSGSETQVTSGNKTDKTKQWGFSLAL